jgi:hypothetical protein
MKSGVRVQHLKRQQQDSMPLSHNQKPGYLRARRKAKLGKRVRGLPCSRWLCIKHLVHLFWFVVV